MVGGGRRSHPTQSGASSNLGFRLRRAIPRPRSILDKYTVVCGAIMDDREWVAQCAARLAEHWHSETVDPRDLDNIALCMSEKMEYRALPPRDAAAEWLRPVLGSGPA